MTAAHVPMHDAGCTRCERKRARDAAYAARMTHRASEKGQKEELRAEIARMQRAHAYSKRHRPGGRALESARRRVTNQRRGQLAVIAHIGAITPRTERDRRPYCDRVGHRWSEWAAAGTDALLERRCMRSACRVRQQFKPKKSARKAA